MLPQRDINPNTEGKVSVFWENKSAVWAEEEEVQEMGGKLVSVSNLFVHDPVTVAFTMRTFKAPSKGMN